MPKTTFLDNDISSNISMIMDEIGQNFDVVLREFQIGGKGPLAAIFYISVLTDTDKVNENVLRPLMCLAHDQTDFQEESLNVSLYKNVVTVGEMKEVTTLKECINSLLKGDTALLIEGITGSIILGTLKWKSRSIDASEVESVVRGPRDSFIETLSVNISLLRRRIIHPELTFVKLQIGERTQRDVVVAYMKGITKETLVQEVLNRLDGIEIDDVPESGYIEQLIEDNHYSPFPQLLHTERPDKVVSALLEGRVAILLEGTPFVLLAPITFNMLLQSPEDYYERWMIGSLLRLLRYIAAILALFFPAIYIAFTSYHQGLIPTRLLISIASSREGVPFPTFIEAIIMEFTIELLREAGVRLPKMVGQAVGIVGGLVIGQAAVQAGIVSPFMVIVVSVTAISSFAFPHYAAAISFRVLRFGFMIAASIFGLYGIMIAFLMLCAHLVKLKSFGVNYTAPFVHYKLWDWKDNLIRVPLQMMKQRPTFLRSKDRKRFK